MVKVEDCLSQLELNEEAGGRLNRDQGVKGHMMKFDTTTPFYVGPHHEVEPYLTWYSKTHIFFCHKGSDRDLSKNYLTSKYESEINPSCLGCQRL